MRFAYSCSLVHSPVLALSLLTLALSYTANAQTISSGAFRGAGGHKARGSVSIVRSSDATRVVFAKNFWFDGAPAPRVAFGNGRYVPGTIIAKLKRRTGSQSYVVPARIDLSKYSQVWVWCEKFNSPIAVADIN